MSLLAAVTLPNGDIQIFQGKMTRWQTSATAWSAASVFPPPANLGAGEYGALAACRNAAGDPVVWGWFASQTNGKPNLVVNSKKSLAAGAGWTGWAELPSSPSNLVDLCAGLSANGKIQLFATAAQSAGGALTLKTCWETSPNSQSYTAWEDFSATTPSLWASGVRAVNLPDGRLQLWAVTATHSLISCYKESTAPGAAWSPWAQVSETSGPAQPSYLIGVGAAPDGVHLWATNSANELVTSHVSQAANAPPSTEHDAWLAAPMPSGTTIVTEIATAKRSDGKIQLFAWASPAQGQGSLYTQGPAPGSSWENIPI